jgi:GNAT superfamily N-acetyltransferase
LALFACDLGVRGLATPRYEGTAYVDLAEVAVVVDPAWRQIGLASALLRMLADAALKRGITRFSATSYADNIDVQDILARSGLPHARTGAGPVVDDVIDLDAAPGDAIPSPPKALRPADPTSLP